MAQTRITDIGIWIFLVNPIAGNPLRQHRLRRMLAQIEAERKPGSFLHITTEDAGHTTKLAEEVALRFGADAVLFICGGDGTVHEAVNGVLSAGPIAKKMPLVILPIGTGNDFARHLYGGLEPNEIMEGLRRDAIVRAVDVIKVQDRYCVNVMSFGLDTRVQMINERLAEKAPFLGETSFILSSLAGILGERRFKMGMEIECIDADGQTHMTRDTFDYTLMAVCNGEYYGGGFHPVPGAESSDGRLEICRVDALSLPGMLRLLPRYRKGRHLSHPAIHRYTVLKGRFFSLNKKKPLLGNLDGEIFLSDQLEFACIPGALNFYLLPDVSSAE